MNSRGRPTTPKLSREYELEDFVEANPHVLGGRILIIGRQVRVAEGRIDLLAIDAKGCLYVIELKHGATEPTVLAQAASYAHSVAALSAEALKSRVSTYWRHASLQTAFEEHFDRPFPRSGLHPVRLIIVARYIDGVTARAASLLNHEKLPIRTFTFTERGDCVDVVECGLGILSPEVRSAPWTRPFLISGTHLSTQLPRDEDVREFWSAYSRAFVWTIIPVTFIHLVYLSWVEDEIAERRHRRHYHLGHFAKALLGIVNESNEWTRVEAVVGDQMDTHEPLVDLVPDWQRPAKGAKMAAYLRLTKGRKRQ